MAAVPIRSTEEFLAHALAIECEAVRRYREFQGWFAERDEDLLAGLCLNLAHFEQEHHDRLAERARGLALPAIDASAWRWPEGGSPEARSDELLPGIATARQMLGIALAAEHQARNYFEWVAHTARDPAVARLARELAAEEDAHAGWVNRALEYLPSGKVEWAPRSGESGGSEPK